MPAIFDFAMPGRCIYDHQGRGDGARLVESIEKPLRCEEDERPCEGDYDDGKVLHEK